MMVLSGVEDKSLIVVVESSRLALSKSAVEEENGETRAVS